MVQTLEILKALGIHALADLEIGDTAGLEACATYLETGS